MVQGRKRSINLAVLVMAILGLQVFGGVSLAHADSCNGVGFCNYGEEVIPKNTKRWFQAATTKRNWSYNYTEDAYGGSVYKCAGTKRDSDYVIIYLGCANNVQFAGGTIPSSWRPGWVFIEHRANGPREIFGVAGCPNC